MTSPNSGDPGILPTANDDAVVAGFEALLTGSAGTQGADEDDDPDADAHSEPDEAEAQAETPDDAEDDDADEAAESEDGEEASEDAEGKPDSIDPETYRVTVKVDGQTEEVSLAEAIRGYQRQAHFTRAQQALAETRKEVESEHQQARGEREQYALLLTALSTKLEQIDQTESIDWDALYRTDPLAYVRQREIARERDDHLRAAKAEQARIEQQRAVEGQKARAARVQETWEAAVAAVPAWRDEKQWDKDRSAIMAYAKEQGFSPKEINDVCSTDVRVLRAMHAAAQYDRLMSNKPRPKAETSAPAGKSSRANAPKPVDEVRRANMRLAKTGRAEDAAVLFERLLK